MELQNKATRIELMDVKTPQMRSFHMTWMAFFLCFFGWFGIAPLMAVVREDLALTKEQIGNTIIASVAITVFVRVLIGPLCDRLGPRRVYTALLVLGGLPVMGIGLAQTYEEFLAFRLAIGAIGAGFVVTQYHTSTMFAPNVIGTANATTAGWGNLGGGVTQMVMPLIFGAMLMLGFSESAGWRLAMIVPGATLMVAGLAYWKFTTDAPDGDFVDLRRRGEVDDGADGKGGAMAGFRAAAGDFRTWALFFVYGACFGVELTINNVAALYYVDRFDLGVATAGLLAGLFGLMNLFARTLGGVLSDRSAKKAGLTGRVNILFLVLAFEGVALVLFSQMGSLVLAVSTMVVFSLFVQMAEGATFGIVPFINRKAVGSVAGIVGAGGNAGAVAAGFLFRAESISTGEALLFMGIAVAILSPMALLVRFSPEEVQRHIEEAQLGTEVAPSGATT